MKALRHCAVHCSQSTSVSAKCSSSELISRCARSLPRKVAGGSMSGHCLTTCAAGAQRYNHIGLRTNWRRRAARRRYTGRRALAVAGDDAEARRLVVGVIDPMGYRSGGRGFASGRDTVRAGNGRFSMDASEMMRWSGKSRNAILCRATFLAGDASSPSNTFRGFRFPSAWSVETSKWRRIGSCFSICDSVPRTAIPCRPAESRLSRDRETMPHVFAVTPLFMTAFWGTAAGCLAIAGSVLFRWQDNRRPLSAARRRALSLSARFS